MSKFYKDLKDYILIQDEKLKKDMIGYYETLLQLENYPEIKDLLNDYENNEFIIDYNEPDEENYYSIGWLDIYENHNTVSYKIELEVQYNVGNHCKCDTSNKEYNAFKKCCGIDCDAYLPRVVVTKEVNLINHQFEGYERDLWALEEKWYTEYDKEIERNKQLENIKSIEDKIEYFQKELELAKAQLK